MAIETYARVALPLPLFEFFTYEVPAELREELQPGHRVEVPWGRRLATGFVAELTDEPELETSRIKPIRSILDTDEPALTPDVLALCRWAADYYLAPPGEMMRFSLPANMSSRGTRSVEVDPEASTEGLSEEAVELLEQVRGSSDHEPLLRSPAVRGPLRELIDAKVITIEESVRDASGVRWEQWVSLKNRDVEATSPQQEEVLDLLKKFDGAEAPRKLLLEAGASSSAVRTLVRHGALVTDKRPARTELHSLMMDSPLTGELNLTSAQQAAVDSIVGSLGTFRPWLLQGVTGSGKTEVYIEAMREIVRRGEQAILLVPEIALTPAAAHRLQERFGDRIAITHSNLTPGERWEQWQRARRGEVDVAVGARSALFTPFERLGLVIVDEEGDGAYKQDETPRYNARDLAVVRGRICSVPVVLGSATPSLETRWNQEQGRYGMLKLSSRIAERALPEVELVDVRKEVAEKEDKGMILFTERLRSELTRVILEGKQAIILINRRGYAPFLLCRECENDFRCRNCSVTLTVHRRSGVLNCHYCEYTIALPDDCPACGGEVLQPIGFGTEKVFERFEKLFPGVPAGLLDRDTARKKGALVETLGKFRRGETRVLIGTQILSKGHDFPGVVLTAVLNADAILGFPDFRSAEKTFYLLTQVSGRSGRGDDPGRVIIQTAFPQHYAVQHAIRHDYESFFREEIEFRERFDYPPVSTMIAILVRGEDEVAVSKTARRIGTRLETALARVDDARMQGPAPAALARLKGVWRYQILVRSRKGAALRRAVASVVDSDTPSGVVVTIDVDPLNLL